MTTEAQSGTERTTHLVGIVRGGGGIVPLFGSAAEEKRAGLEEAGRLEEEDDHVRGTADGLLREVDDEVRLYARNVSVSCFWKGPQE